MHVGFYTFSLAGHVDRCVIDFAPDLALVVINSEHVVLRVL